MGDRPVVQAEDSLDQGRVGLRNLNGPGVAAVGPVWMLEADEFDGESFFHVGRGAGKGDGAAENLVAALEDLQIVLAGKLFDFVDAGGSAPYILAKSLWVRVWPRCCARFRV